MTEPITERSQELGSSPSPNKQFLFGVFDRNDKEVSTFPSEGEAWDDAERRGSEFVVGFSHSTPYANPIEVTHETGRRNRLVPRTEGLRIHSDAGKAGQSLSVEGRSLSGSGEISYVQRGGSSEREA